MKLRITTALALVVFLWAGAAAARKVKKPVTLAFQEDPAGELFARLQTSKGEILARLFEKEAPKTVENFVALATGKKEWKHPGSEKWQTDRPLYDGTAFHRVIPDFMIQAGDPFSSSADGDPSQVGRGGPGYRFEDETGNGKSFNRGGYLAMANSGPDTNGSQFFITEAATPHLDGKHTIFGEVVQGFDLVPIIARAGNMETKLEKVTIVRGKMAPAKKK
jgi:peptidyl-prolyl cis-trans isomerase A (cyclophilin A)